MTPSEIETAARRQYNATSDSFFSTDELYQIIYGAEVELAREALCIENTYTTSTAIGTQTYTYPSTAIAIKRITYSGTKLKVINMREDDLITLADQATANTGTPEYYFIWNRVIYLRPVPNAVDTLKVFSIDMPAALNTSSTSLDVPIEFHWNIVDYVTGRMAAKDSQFDQADFYDKRWQKAVLDAKRWARKRLRRDAMSNVIDEEVVINTVLGQL